MASSGMDAPAAYKATICWSRLTEPEATRILTSLHTISRNAYSTMISAGGTPGRSPPASPGEYLLALIFRQHRRLTTTINAVAPASLLAGGGECVLSALCQAAVARAGAGPNLTPPPTPAPNPPPPPPTLAL